MTSNGNGGDDVQLLLWTHFVVARRDRHLNTIEGPITDESFDDYVPTRTDPGSLLLIIAMFICGISLVSLPICTTFLKKQSQFNIIRRRKTNSMKKDKNRVSCDFSKEEDDIQLDNIEVATIDPNETMRTTTTDSLCDELQNNEDDENINHRQRLSTCILSLRQSLQYCWKLARFDNEMKRILFLAISFTLSAFAYNAGNMVILAIISHYMGTDEVVAYCMVHLMVGVTSSFLGSWVDAISSLGIMAYGAKNNTSGAVPKGILSCIHSV